MRIASVSDLHLDHAANRELMPALAAEIHRYGADLVVIAGDVSHLEVWIERAIRSFQVVAPRVAYVPGNHDLWQAPEQLERGANTWARYRDDLRALVTDLGAAYLPSEPLRLGTVAVAGTCGWYDYGFMLPEHRELMTPERGRTKRWERYQWSDANFVAFRGSNGDIMSDHDVVEVMLAELAAQLEALQEDVEVEQIFVATHHLPFDELVLRSGTLPWEFFNAFMGSPRLGALLSEYSKVRSVVYGHTHRGRQLQRGNMVVMGTPLGYPRERADLSREEVIASRIGWWDL